MISVERKGLQVVLASLVIFGGVACREESQSEEAHPPPEITSPSSTITLTPTATLIDELGQIIDIDDPVIELCKALPVETPKGSSGEFVWPTYGGPLYKYFSKDHPGIDISPSFGSPVYAAAGGVVVLKVKAIWGYGEYIVVSHGSYLTLYAHLSEILVNLGDEIPKKELVGLVGSTGLSTGAHLHFEVIKKEGNSCQRINPFNLLP